MAVGSEPLGDLVAERGARDGAAAVRDEDRAGPGRACPGASARPRAASPRAGAVLPRRPGHPRRPGPGRAQLCPPRRARATSPGPSLELRGRVLVDVHLPWAGARRAIVRARPRPEGRRSPAASRDRSLTSVTRGSVCLVRGARTATDSAIAGVTPSTSDEPVSAFADRDGVPLREVLGTGRELFGRRLELLALRGHELVRLAEHVDRERSDRVAHRVAGGQGSRDDRGAEHEPDDDQGSPARTARRVTDAEAGEHAVTRRQHPDGARAPTRRSRRARPRGLPSGCRRAPPPLAS